MIAVGRLCLLIALLFGGVARADDGIYFRAKKLDPMGNEKLRRLMPGAYRSPLGMQIHAECFEQAQAQDPKLTRSEAEVRAERWIAASLHGVMDRCQARYPELTPYIQEWISQARRAVIFCADRLEPDSDLRTIAGNMPQQSDVSAVLTERQRHDLEHELSWRDWFSDLPELKKTAIVFPSREFRMMLQVHDGRPNEQVEKLDPYYAKPFDFQDTLIHEVFHSTNAGNQEARFHNRIHKTENAQSVCDSKLPFDRIYALGSLCSGNSLFQTQPDLSMADIFFLRQSKCNRPASECADIFASRYRPTERFGSEKSFPVPSEGLKREQAQMLCMRIFDAGYCRKNTQEKAKDLIKDNVTLRELHAQSLQALREFFGSDDDHLGAKLLKKFPAEANGLQSFQSTDCFKANFSLTEVDGSLEFALRLRGDLEGGYRMSVRGLELYAEPALATIAKAKRRLEQDPTCSSIKSYLGATLDSLDHALRDPLADQHLVAAIAVTDPSMASVNTKFVTDFLREAGHPMPLLEKVLGAGRIQEIAAAVKRFHPASPDFDCAAAGLSPYLTYMEAQRLLNSVAATEPANSCDR